MIREDNPRQLSIEEFKTPFYRGLDKSNHRVRLARVLSWEELTKIYRQTLTLSFGRPAIPILFKTIKRLPSDKSESVPLRRWITGGCFLGVPKCETGIVLPQLPEGVLLISPRQRAGTRVDLF